MGASKYNTPPARPLSRCRKSRAPNKAASTPVNTPRRCCAATVRSIPCEPPSLYKTATNIG